MNQIMKRAFINATGTLAHILLVVLLISSLQNAIPKASNTILIPIAMLLLFVFSAGLTGGLVFGKPVLVYLEGRKKEAVHLVAYTLAFLLLFTLITFILMVSLI